MICSKGRVVLGVMICSRGMVNMFRRDMFKRVGGVCFRDGSVTGLLGGVIGLCRCWVAKSVGGAMAGLVAHHGDGGLEGTIVP
jgi:hypothetical protein